MQKLICQPLGVVCIRVDALVGLGEWIADMRSWALSAYLRCGPLPRGGSFGAP